MSELGQYSFPKFFSSFKEEYRYVSEGTGLTDRSFIGRLKIQGEDSLDLLNRLSTNNLESLNLGMGLATVLTTNKGRVVDFLIVVKRSNNLLVLTSEHSIQKVMDWIDLYTFIEDVKIVNCTESSVMFHLLGPKSAQSIVNISKLKDIEIKKYECVTSYIDDIPIEIVRTDAYGVLGYDIITRASNRTFLWDKLIKFGGQFNIQPIGTNVLEVIRIVNGIPLYGRELGEKFNPHEANLLQYVSFNKGCYIGQEVIARLNTYKKVQKYLFGIIVESDLIPLNESKVIIEHEGEIGFVTSASRSLTDNKTVALAYINKKHCEPGKKVFINSKNGQLAGILVELPFMLDAIKSELN